MRTRYLDFKLTNKEWNKQKPFLALDLNALKNGESKQVQTLLRWTPQAFKSKCRVRLLNKRTKQSINWEITEVEHLDGWLVVKWDPNEPVNAIMRTLPVVIASGMIASIVTQGLRKEARGACSADLTDTVS